MSSSHCRHYRRAGRAITYVGVQFNALGQVRRAAASSHPGRQLRRGRARCRCCNHRDSAAPDTPFPRQQPLPTSYPPTLVGPRARQRRLKSRIFTAAGCLQPRANTNSCTGYHRQMRLKTRCKRVCVRVCCMCLGARRGQSRTGFCCADRQCNCQGCASAGSAVILVKGLHWGVEQAAARAARGACSGGRAAMHAPARWGVAPRSRAAAA